MRSRMKKVKYLCFVALLTFNAVLGSGCGTGGEKGHQENTIPVIVNNFDFNGNRIQIPISKMPERVIVARPEILELLLALGVREPICAVYLTKDYENRLSEWQKVLPHAKFYTHELDKETALMRQPDFLLGWRMSFRNGALGNVDFWQDRNIPTYIEENSGPVPAVDPFPPSTVETEIRFIQNMGIIFQKEKEAQKLMDGIRQSLQDGLKKNQEQQAHQVITIEFMRDKIEVFGDKLLSGDIIKKLGSHNINYEIPFISREEFRVCEADTIFIIYHGGKQEAANALQQLFVPEFSGIPAVKNKRVYLLPYRYVCASNVYTAQTIREIAEGLYE